MKRNQDGRLCMDPLPVIRRKSKIIFIGESVHLDEIRAREYFQSEGGDALRKTISRCGYNPNHCAYTVVAPFIMNKAKTMSEAVWKENYDRVWREIAQSEAEYVVPLGALAVQMILNDKKTTMKKVIGNVIQQDGRKIIPNYHPASLFHNPGNYKVFEQIMQTTIKMVQGVQLDPGKTEFEIIDTNTQMKELLEKLQQISSENEGGYPVGVDIETNSLCTWKAEIWVVGISTRKNHSYVITREAIQAAPTIFQQIMLLSNLRYVWHNGKYDENVLYWSGVDARVDEDTILLHYCLNETSGTHNLGQCSTMYLGADEYKSKMNSEFSNIKTEADYFRYKAALCERVAVDTDYTRQLYTIFKPMVQENKDLDRLYNTTLMRAHKWACRVQQNGMKVDVPYLESRKPGYEQQIADITKEIQEAAAPYWDPQIYKDTTGAKTADKLFKPTSTKQMKFLVWDVLKLKPTIRCKRGETGAEVLESIENPPEFVLKVLELRKVKKEYKAFCTSYLDNRDSSDLVHATFNLHATTSGRLSCTDPNLQQVPSSKPEVRRAFIPRGPGRIMMEIDYSGAELRVLAWISGDEDLQKAVTEGDMHSDVARSIFGPNFTKVQRGIAKTVNFGIAYGRGANDLHAAFPEYSVEECQGWIQGWIDTYPKAWAYLQSCADDVEAGRTLVTPYGRHRRMGLISPKALKSLSNEAKNFRIQSISSDNTLTSAMDVEEEVTAWGGYTVNFIHDSILFDVPGDPESVYHLSRFIVETMEAQPKKQYDCDVKFHCDVDLGPNWGDLVAYDYKTQTVKTKNGTIPYDVWYENEILSKCNNI